MRIRDRSDIIVGKKGADVIEAQRALGSESYLRLCLESVSFIPELILGLFFNFVIIVFGPSQLDTPVIKDSIDFIDLIGLD